MKKYLPCIAGGILGALFLMASVMFFLGLGPRPDFPEGSPHCTFHGGIRTDGLPEVRESL